MLYGCLTGCLLVRRRHMYTIHKHMQTLAIVRTYVCTCAWHTLFSIVELCTFPCFTVGVCVRTCILLSLSPFGCVCVEYKFPNQRYCVRMHSVSFLSLFCFPTDSFCICFFLFAIRNFIRENSTLKQQQQQQQR